MAVTKRKDEEDRPIDWPEVDYEAANKAVDHEALAKAGFVMLCSSALTDAQLRSCYTYALVAVVELYSEKDIDPDLWRIAQEGLRGRGYK